jgi:4'-phosphopantetheinyl transferase EntD
LNARTVNGSLGESVGALLPDGVVVIAVEVESVDGTLWPVELWAIRGAGPKRRREFAVGRTCARRALEQLGLEPVGIPVGTMREPVWPRGVVGSIAYCDAHCVVAAADDQSVLSLGIDIEPAGRIAPSVSDIVTTEEERRWLVDKEDSDLAATLLFVLKEAASKAWSPLTRRRLEPRQVAIEVHPSTATFSAAVCLDPPHSKWPAAGAGRYHLGADKVIGAVAIAREHPAPERC